MRLKLFYLMLGVFIIAVLLTSCKTIQVIPLSTPPVMYEPHQVDTVKDLSREYQESIIKIIEWQKWFNIQVSSNYYHSSGVEDGT